jgi:hypothetical protein
MDDQEALFNPDIDAPDIGAFHRVAPDTERVAAISVYARTGTQRRKVYDYLAAKGSRGATDWELAEALHISRTGVGARRNELMQAGYVRDSGKRRRGPYKLLGIVWVLTDKP